MSLLTYIVFAEFRAYIQQCTCIYLLSLSNECCIASQSTLFSCLLANFIKLLRKHLLFHCHDIEFQLLQDLMGEESCEY